MAGSEATESEAQALLDRLEARRGREAVPDRLPRKLPVSAIKRYETLFQPRAEVASHLADLARVLRNDETFDPLTVIQIGKEPVLVDGHHRHTAYMMAKVKTPVPVAYFEGSVAEAVIEAGEANRKAKLPMTGQQRLDRAWQLVMLGRFSKEQERQGSGVSYGTIGSMRKARRDLGAGAEQHKSWWAALAASKGQERARLSDDEMEEWLETQAADYAQRLHKTFGSKLTGNIDLAAMALEQHFGDRIAELARALGHHAKSEDDFEGEF